ncbi:MAG: SGNH/GDSL hydrolase family protein [Cyanobacteria bacterium J06560_2]
MKYLNRSVSVLGATLGLLSLSYLLPLQAATAKDYSSLNVFGDSLVDAGNIFNLTGFPPSPLYDQKLSNGPVWVETLAAELDLSPELSSVVLPDILSGTGPVPTAGINYALAGSLSSDLNTGGPELPGLQQQIETFAALSQVAPPDADALHVLLAGGNDYNQAIRNPTADLTLLPEQVTDNLTTAATTLIGAGAKNLLIVNLPALGDQPLADNLNQLNPQSSTLLTGLSTQHNLLLSQKISALEATTEAHITQLDLAGFFIDATTNPAKFGLTNVENSCLLNPQPDSSASGVCQQPDEFLFWDDIHPTAAVHSAIAQFALTTLNKSADGPKSDRDSQDIPEPSAIIGLLALASVTLWQQRSVPKAAK